MSCRLSFLRLRRQKKERPRINGTAKHSSLASNPNPPSKHPNPQLQSLFITCLPLDIRVLIYEYVLASTERLHIINWLTNLGHVECKEEVMLDTSDNDRRSRARSVTHNKCLGYETPERAPRGPWPVLDGGKMGLLACCGIVYSEAVEILYSYNTFDLTSVSTFQTFTTTISPHSLHTIRSLSLSLFYHAWFPHSSVENLRQVTCPPEFKFEWKKCCDTLAAIEQLQELKVKIGFSPQNAERAALMEGLWFEELRRVGRVREFEGRGLRGFEVGVNWQRSGYWDGPERRENNLPFRLVRYVGVGMEVDPDLLPY